MKKCLSMLLAVFLALSGCNLDSANSHDSKTAETHSADTPKTDTTTTPESGTDSTDSGETTPEETKPSGTGTIAVPSQLPVATKPATLASLTVKTLPFKTAYQEGDAIDLAGLSISENWSDGTTRACAADTYEVSSIDMSVPGKKTVVVSRPSAQTSFSVFVYSADTMIPVSGGTFLMGSDADDSLDNAEHSVAVTSFLIGRYETTYALWKTILSWAKDESPTPYVFANAGKEGNDGVAGAEATSDSAEPVTYINWLDAVVWCNAYSEMNGLSPVYFEDTEKKNVCRSSKNDVPVTVDASANGYRLPTEAEWEFAAGGGEVDRTMYAGTSTLADLPLFAWNPSSCAQSGAKKTWPVGTKKENGSGAYDMSGNVTEWCDDWYESDPSGVTLTRVVRGGSWSGTIRSCAVAARGQNKYTGKSSTIGFRVVRNP